MNETKRRGRPPKAKACEECGQLEGHYDDCATGMGVTKPQEGAEFARRQAQAYALRVWQGQSVSALRSWRIERVKAALDGQGLSFDGVTLP